MFVPDYVAPESSVASFHNLPGALAGSVLISGEVS